MIYEIKHKTYFSYKLMENVILKLQKMLDKTNTFARITMETFSEEGFHTNEPCIAHVLWIDIDGIRFRLYHSLLDGYIGNEDELIRHCISSYIGVVTECDEVLTILKEYLIK